MLYLPFVFAVLGAIIGFLMGNLIGAIGGFVIMGLVGQLIRSLLTNNKYDDH
tara:strand:- start:216 stop:371 length:156 start_codon:yes stop_codon:yes gene_type:complete